MSFLSVEHALLLLGTLGVYWPLRGRARTVLLLAASYLFYCWAEPAYGLIVAASTGVDYVAALAIDGTESPRRRRAFLVLSITFNLALLAYFKYARGALLPPVGISFYTFQEMAYTIDVYRRRVRPVRDPLVFATFVAFFPQLTAGPIERASALLPQLAGPRRLRAEQLGQGVTLLLLGLAKKLVLADRLAFFAAPHFEHPDGFPAGELAVCLLVMPVALYLDLAAYTDMARGSAKLFGLELGQNFHFPFAFTSPADFWRRWHMSLSAWIRDYVFLPLGGIRREAPLRTAGNAIVVMTLFGLWHGAAWHFVLWGAGHGAGLAAYYLLRLHVVPRWPALRTRAAAAIGWLATAVWILALVPLFFSPSWAIARAYWTQLIGGDWTRAPSVPSGLAVAVALSVVAFHWLGRRADEQGITIVLPAAARGMAVATLLYVVLYGAAPLGQGFVYVRF